MPRLFTGIELPENVRERLGRLRTPLPGARWIDAENLHVTLRFVGDVDNAVASEFAHALGAIRMDAFPIRIRGLGAFGGNSPRILWAGVEGGPTLEALARAHERAARNAGLEPERRTFRPHVTLARFQHARADGVARFLERNGAFFTESFLVDRFVLFSSRPQTGGGPYAVEADYPLAASGFESKGDTGAEW